MKKPCFFLLLFCSSLLVAAEVDSYYLQAEKLYKSHRYDSAVICFSEVIVQYPEKKEGYYNRGLSFYHLSRFPQAIADFERCLQIDSSFLDAQFMKAISLQKQGDLRKAIHELELLKAKNRDYDEVEKRIKNYRFAVYLSETWYYMIAIILLFIVLVAIIAKSISYRKW